MSTPTRSKQDSRFWAWLQGTAPYPKSLAWCHSTDGWVLRETIGRGAFTTRHCDVFDEDLSYFFYGRPAYRYGDQDSLGTSGRAPVAFIFDASLSRRGKRLFPFDSGAFRKNLYRRWMHPLMTLTDFEMACPSDAPQRHVSSFFGSNTAYVKLQARKPTTASAGEFEVESLTALLTDPSIRDADDRRVAVELQLDAPVPFASPYVRAIVLPDELRSAPFVDAYFNGPGAGVIAVFYSLAPLKRALDYQVPIEERAIQLQDSWGWL